jgi:hypothetical protein
MTPLAFGCGEAWMNRIDYAKGDLAIELAERSPATRSSSHRYNTSYPNVE